MVRPKAWASAVNARGGRLTSLLFFTLVLGTEAAQAQPVYETVVTAPPDEARADRTASASVVTTARTPRSGESLPQLLSELPGVSISRLGSLGSLATISVRGSSPNQVLVYVDGVPLNSSATGVVDVGLMPMAALDRIEVYRGGSPFAFGSSGIGGVVSLTSEPPTRSGVRLHSGAGSFGTQFAGAELAWAGPRLQVLGRVSAFGSRADFPYASDNGTLFDRSDDAVRRRENNQLEQLDANLRAAIALPGHRRLQLAASALGRDQGLPSVGTVRSLESSLATRRVLGSLSYDGREAVGRLKATAYTLAGEQRFDDPRGEIAFGATRTRDRSFTVGGTTQLSHDFGAPLRLTLLADGRHERFSPREELRGDERPPGTRAFGALGVESNLWLSALNLEVVPSVRLEAAHDQISLVDSLGRPRMDAVPSEHLLPVARVGVGWRPVDGVRVRANGGRYARLPTLSERYGNGGVIVGNPALAPERGNSGDLGATWAHRWEEGTITLDGALFASRTRDLIHFQKGSYHARYRNVGRARVVGAELSMAARVRKLHLISQGTITDARDESGASASHGRQLAHRPRVRAYARPELRELPLGRHLTGGIYADMDVTGGTYADAANLVRFPARLTFGAGLSLGWRPAGLHAVFSAHNLGDSRVNDVLDYPLPGRSFFVTMSFTYPYDTQLEPKP